MKKIFLIFCSVALYMVSFSQDLDNRLLTVYSSQELQEIKTKDVELYNALVYGLDNNAAYLTDFPEGKESDLKDVPSIEMPSSDFTFASLGYKIIDNANQIYKIKGTDKILIIKSGFVLKYELKNKK